MTADKIPFTKMGLQTLKNELAWLETEKLKQVKQRVKRARSFCDFHEDSEYEAALSESEKVQQRISHLKHTIQQATIIEPTDHPVVEIGKTVTIQELPNGIEETYTIVNREEADPFQAKISNQSPMAKSLLNTEVDDEVTVITPTGSRKIKIINID